MNKRPKILLKKSKMERLFETLSLGCILTAVIYIASVWSSLPSTIPTHFNAAGNPDGWGGKGSIWFLPVLSTFLFILFLFLSRVPHLHNYPMEITEENAEKMYRSSRKLLAVTGFEVCNCSVGHRSICFREGWTGVVVCPDIAHRFIQFWREDSFLNEGSK